MTIQKRRLAVLALIAVAVGCSNGAARGVQLFSVDSDTVVWVAAQGFSAKSPSGAPSAGPGGVNHRILQGPDGSVLFAYDLTVRRSARGGYILRFIPAATGPTFSEAREAEVAPTEMASVDIMQDLRTGATVADTFRFMRHKGLMAIPSLSSLLHGLVK